MSNVVYQTTTVGEYCPFIYGKSLPKTKRLDGVVPVYGSNGVVDNHNDFCVDNYGIIIGRKGSVGAIHISEIPFWAIDTAFYVQKDSLEELHFTYYLLKSLGLDKMNSDSAVPGLNRDNAHSLKIKIPKNLEDRKNIGIKLAIFDKKIQLNTETNQTLEAIAQALFKSWFIDFDPVRAKARVLNSLSPRERAGVRGQTQATIEAMKILSGKTTDQLTQLAQDNPKDYQQLQTTAEAFPSGFGDDGLPIGWEKKPLGELVSIKRGGSPRPIKDFITDAGLNWVKIADATSEKSPFLFRTKECIKEEGLNKTVSLKKGSLILSNSATPGIPKFLDIDACIHDGWLHFPEINILTPEYLYLLFLNMRKMLVAQGNGSVFTNLKTDIVKAQIVTVAPDNIISFFSEIISIILQNIKNNCYQAHTLSSVRDGLLPKLLNGEI